jgi:hypothetical protein
MTPDHEFEKGFEPCRSRESFGAEYPGKLGFNSRSKSRVTCGRTF